MPDTKIINAPDTEMVCYCGNVTKGQIIKAIKNGDNTFSKLSIATGICPATSNCKANNPKKRCCSSDIMELLAHYNGGKDCA